MATHGLTHPFTPFINTGSALAAAPRSVPINHHNETSQQWGMNIQHALTKDITLQAGYNGQQNYYVFSRTRRAAVFGLRRDRPVAQCRCLRSAAAGTWGNLGRDVLRAPGVFQIDTALSKKFALTEKLGLEFGIQGFNVANHPLLAAPSANISSASSFGRITAPLNTSPIGAGTPRRIQAFVRFSF